MPVYQYLDSNDGAVIVELVREVDRRDDVPSHLKRIQVPVRLAIHGSSSSPRDPHDADQQVPAAYKQLEATVGAREIVKESGYSVQEVKEIWNI